MRTFWLCGLFLFLAFSSRQALAEWYPRATAGLGFTDNANYETTGKDSDFYYLARGSTSYVSDGTSYSGMLSYRGYFEENQNNALNYRLGTAFPVEIIRQRDWELDLGLGGQTFTEGAPGWTEDLFDYYYADATLIKNFNFEGADVSIEPRYELRHYPHFDKRTDHTLAFGSFLEWAPNKRNRIEPSAELGFALSSDDLYTRSYFEIGTDWEWFFRRNLKTDFNFLARFTTYPNRTVSDRTAVSEKRGRNRIAAQDDKETQTFSQIGFSVAKISKQSELKAGIVASSQRSKSGTANYSELGLMSSAQISF